MGKGTDCYFGSYTDSLLKLLNRPQGGFPTPTQSWNFKVQRTCHPACAAFFPWTGQRRDVEEEMGQELPLRQRGVAWGARHLALPAALPLGVCGFEQVAYKMA